MSDKYDKKHEKCPVCSSSAIRYYHTDFRENNIYKCDNCQVQFMNPVYSDDYLADYYAGYIIPEYTQKTIDQQQEISTQNFSAIDKFLPNKGEMLDFGMGSGAYSEYARKLGWNVSGYDVDCNTTSSLAKKLSMDIRCGDFEKLDWGGKKFDLIYSHHVIEHLKDPVTRLKSFHAILKDEAYLYIGVPNISAWSSRIKFFLEKWGIKKGRVGRYYDTDHHVMYYNPGSMQKLLQRTGFKVVCVSNGTKPKPYQNPVLKFIRKNIKEKLIPGAAFFVIAKKI